MAKVLRHFLEFIKTRKGSVLLDALYKRRQTQSMAFVSSEADIVASSHSANNTTNKVWVRRVRHEDRMQAKLQFTYPNGYSRVIRLDRFITEPVTFTLDRLAANIEKHATGKKKRKLTSSLKAPDSKPTLYKIFLSDKNGQTVAADSQNSIAWSQGSILTIGDFKYEVELNAPSVSNLALPKILLAGFPVIPEIETEFTDPKECEYVWSQVTNGEDSSRKKLIRGRNKFYIPQLEDVGHYLELQCIPKKRNQMGESITVESTNTVRKGPASFPFESRHTHCSEFTHKHSFRILSYNVLADTYTDSDYSRNELFAYCPLSALDYNYRRQLILQEILDYKADIICLQEMDTNQYLNYYKPYMDQNGYHSSMAAKCHMRLPVSGVSEQSVNDEPAELITGNEGCAIFYKTSKFRLVAHHSMHIPQALNEHPLYQDLLKIAKQSQLVHEKILYRSGTPLLALLLESIEDPFKTICVGNTHLYFHPKGTPVRLLQAAASLRFLNDTKVQFETNRKVPVIYCGDFNSSPTSPLVNYILSGHVNSAHSVWTEDDLYLIPGGAELKHSLNLESACGFPEFTNFTPDFKECLDYIFYEKDLLNVEAVVPFPSAEVLARHNGGIPSEVHPSDHIPLVSTFRWKN